MEVGVLKPAADTVSGQPPRTAALEQGTESVKAIAKVEAAESKSSEQQAEQKKVKPAEMKSAVTAVNKFLEYMTADLRFKYNDKVDIMQVQLIGGSDQRVLREYPPKEFLEMIASIRASIGIFLDKKA